MGTQMGCQGSAHRALWKADPTPIGLTKDWMTYGEVLISMDPWHEICALAALCHRTFAYGPLLPSFHKNFLGFQKSRPFGAARELAGAPGMEHCLI